MQNIKGHGRVRKGELLSTEVSYESRDEIELSEFCVYDCDFNGCDVCVDVSEHV